jgi:D-sedoheptulose 7-phosphate isomerase
MQNLLMKSIFLQSVSHKINEINNHKIKLATKLILNKKKNNKIILAGNGASATISSHVSVDLTKSAGIRAVNFNDPGLLTCFSNDYGYENWLKKALEFHSIPGDVLILISSSGNSRNIINAAKAVQRLKLNLITLSGFSKKNHLLNRGDINFHVESQNYNVVESVHLIILLQIVENLVRKK